MLQITVSTDEESGLCPIRNVLVGISGKWQSLIILSLEDGPLRFNQIKRVIGDISQRVLTQNLRTLERDGHITRTVSHGPPIAVSYQLTPLGHEFLEIWKPVALWAENKFEAVTAARKKYEAKSK
ncbi:MAG: helix-turn-helix domain-containing protein [Rhizobiaceae bacterium]